MKAIRGIYQEGEIKPLEPVPEVESAAVLIIFPDAPEPKDKEGPPETDLEAELFGCGKDWWTDEVDAAVRESWAVRSRPWEKEGEQGFDAPL